MSKIEQQTITSIERADRRSDLEPRRAPHWKRIAEGRYIGFRYMTRGSAGTWLARAWIEGKYVYETLGDFAVLPDGKRYDAALAAANAWWDHLAHGGAIKAVTVKQACEAYVENRRAEKGERAARGAEGFLRRLVYSDPIASVELAKLAPRHCAEWKQRALAASGTKVSCNRSLVPLVAALNLAHDRRDVASNHAWRKELKKYKNAENADGRSGKREIYLTRTERSALLAAMSDEARPLFVTLCLLPLRPGIPRQLKVADFHSVNNVLHVPVDKDHPARDISLSNGVLAHFKACVQDKLPGAWLFAQADGEPWTGNAQERCMREAVAKAGLPKATCAYSIRHSVITDLLKAQINAFDVAALAGTSVLMLQKHYYHLLKDDTHRALQTLELAA